MGKLKICTFLTLAATTMICVAGCASGDDVPNAVKVEQKIAEARTEEVNLIKSTIADPAKLEQMLLLLKERDQLLGRYVKVLSQYSDEILAMNADYNTSREEFEGKISGYNEDRQALQHEFARLLESMKKQTNADEWKSISKFQLKKLNPREIAYDQALGGD